MVTVDVKGVVIHGRKVGVAEPQRRRREKLPLLPRLKRLPLRFA